MRNYFYLSCRPVLFSFVLFKPFYKFFYWGTISIYRVCLQQGASLIDGNKIVLGLTARGKDADKFWFSLFHELAHIVLGHVGQPNGTSEDDEKEADRWSGDILIDSKDFEDFRRNGDYSESQVLQFAKAQGIAPGIIVGRMQLEGMIKYSMLNNLKEKY